MALVSELIGVGNVGDIRGVVGRGVELQFDVRHRGTSHRDEGSRDSAFGRQHPGLDVEVHIGEEG